MRHQAQVAIRLEAAYLCECGQIIDSGDECMCGNTMGLLKLSPVLNRTTPEIPRNRQEAGVGARSMGKDFKYDY